MRGIKLHSETCLCHLKQYWFSNNAEAYEKSRTLVCHMVVDSNIANDSLPTLQISVGIIALFEKIYNGETILTIPLFELSV